MVLGNKWGRNLEQEMDSMYQRMSMRLTDGGGIVAHVLSQTTVSALCRLAMPCAPMMELDWMANTFGLPPAMLV